MPSSNRCTTISNLIVGSGLILHPRKIMINGYCKGTQSTPLWSKLCNMLLLHPR
ncbi:hypothetical protein ZIOFF_007564 [Zingiber officinale]|uniref:Uncharacterized protein n=1 Tax=Zingiber officinale TaxID=94328 RepID=A0A8J5IGM4_ZINOF|nr:hypothetical protein ZIOFF_007564 [Zingiber officinale]